MKVAIISFAHMHAYAYANVLLSLPDVEFVSIYDENLERGRSVAKQFSTTYHANLDTLLNDTELEAVIICSENVKHREHVLAAAQAGKHILCEKPLATSVEDAWAMVRACETANVILQTAFPVRFAPPFVRMKKLLDNQVLGRILALRGTNHGRNPGGWFVEPALSGGGAVLDHTVHLVDIMRWFLNSEVVEVFAEIDTSFSKIATDDCGLLSLKFANGVIASHDPSWSRPKSFATWGDVTLKIVGTDGVAEVDALGQHMNQFTDRTMTYSHAFWGDGYDTGLILDFVDCVRRKRSPSITGIDGLRAMQVALAACESAQRKQPVILSY